MTSALGRTLGLIVCAAALLFGHDVARAAATAPPVPTRWVTDNAGFLTPETRDALDTELSAYERRTGHQVIVSIGTTTGDVPLEDYTVKAFAAWKLGRKGLDDGLALFVFAKDRKVRIEIGYGLEPVVTDAAAAEIIRNIIVPQLRAGNNDAAITDGVAQLLAKIDGSPAPEANGGATPAYGSGGEAPSQSQPLSPLTIIMGIIVLIGFIILFIRSPGFALWLLFSLLSGGRGGGGGFSGGGSFSGGGGRSGGGGASGSW